jgi:Uma2 family endonuclease
MAIQERVYSAEDLWELSHRREYADKRLELVEGVLIEMSPAGGKHGGLASKADRRIGDFVEEHDLGYTTAAETGFILFKNPNGKDTVRAPDVGFVAAHRLPDGLPEGYIPFAPDLAVEVVSPTDTADEIHEKVSDFIKYGTRLIWVYYPKSKTAMVHMPGKTYPVEAGGVLDGGDILPGFRMSLHDLFGE